nr:ADP-heptose--LPS heptosyltransferase 2 [Klebsiella pneumoniae]
MRKGDAAEGYHQSLIDITPERVLQELNELLAEKPSTRKRNGCGY